MTTPAHPEVPPSEKATLSGQGGKEAANPPGSAPRILLVEDHGDTAVILTRLLRRMGYEVVYAASVSAAVQTAKEAIGAGKIDLVLSDLGLPDGSGLDLMRTLSGKYGLRGIALSGYGMDADVAESRAAGFSRHLIKPIDVAVLRSALAEMLPRA